MPNPEEVKLIHLIEQNRSAVTAIAPVHRADTLPELMREVNDRWGWQ